MIFISYIIRISLYLVNKNTEIIEYNIILTVNMVYDMICLQLLNI